METTQNKVFAVAGSLVVHALVVLVLYLGLLRQPELIAVDAEGPAIEATLVSSPQQSAAAMQSASRPSATAQQRDTAPAPQPKPGRSRRIRRSHSSWRRRRKCPNPIPWSRTRFAVLAELAAKQKLDQEQEERHKQAQIDLSRKQEQQEAENRQRQAQQQLEKDSNWPTSARRRRMPTARSSCSKKRASSLPIRRRRTIRPPSRLRSPPLQAPLSERTR